MSFQDPTTARIAEFLSGIGLAVEIAKIDEECFLPGVQVSQGRLQVDECRLLYPGDLLHEAGHLALAPASLRPRLSGNIEVPGFDAQTLECGAIAWSFAAACAMALDAAVVFHPDGYQGRSEQLLFTFSMGVYIGVAQLEGAGMTVSGSRAAAQAVKPYPHMIRWLRE
jgi:hypothetical protein